MNRSARNGTAGMWVVFFLALLIVAGPAMGAEIREYNGVKLTPFDRKYDNSIKGPQKIDGKTYRLEITGW